LAPAGALLAHSQAPQTSPLQTWRPGALAQRHGCVAFIWPQWADGASGLSVEAALSALLGAAPRSLLLAGVPQASEPTSMSGSHERQA
jgi:hypothetical protein